MKQKWTMIIFFFYASLLSTPLPSTTPLASQKILRGWMIYSQSRRVLQSKIRGAKDGATTTKAVGQFIAIAKSISRFIDLNPSFHYPIEICTDVALDSSL